MERCQGGQVGLTETEVQGFSVETEHEKEDFDCEGHEPENRKTASLGDCDPQT